MKFLCYYKDDGPLLVWVSCLAPNTIESKRYKYTVQIRNQDVGETGILFQGTRRCVPCDLSHDEVREKGCYLVLDEETIEDAMKGEEGKIDVTMTIDKV